MAGDAVEGELEDPALDRWLADARPEGDALTRAVWRSRVALALFGEAEPAVVGRYRLGRQLGQGGGGSVFAAADPKLHREVAVKLIRCASQGHRDRALTEGRALAKLSHPNVVAVHDVGETEEHVYLVMELLRGESLRQLAAGGGGVGELVAAYCQAASGLAAAHDAGLVHRDFKPDNAMFGDDGRLRVVDFGLAADAEAGDAVPGGTPRYMAPEQRAGAPTSARADQYALGVALREAVTAGGRREPAWLARVVTRATAEQPAQRYPSMAALARALADDPRSRWRRRVLIGAPIALAIAGFGIGWSATTRGTATCAGGPETLASAWTPARVDEVVRHVEQLDDRFAVASAPLVRDKLRALGDGWLTAHRQSCSAHERGELSDDLYDRATVCLARTRIEIGEAVGLLAAATRERLSTAIGALGVVDRVERCADPAALAAEASPQPTEAMRAIDQQIEIAAIHARAATPRADDLAAQATAAARSHGDRHLLARALLVLGHAHMSSGLERAIAPLHEAMLLAIAAGLDDVATEAFARHAYAIAATRPAERERALDGLELARAIGQRAGERGAFGRALLANNVGAIAEFNGDFRAARTGFEQAVKAAREVTGPGRVELVIALSNLAMITPDAAERRHLYEAAVAESAAAVGPDHPETLDKRLQAAADGDDPRAAVTALAELCGRLAGLHSALYQLIEAYALELAWQATALGMREHVHGAARMVEGQTDEPGLPRTLIAAYEALATGSSPALIARLDALARQEADRIARDGWRQNLFAADAELALAAAAHAANDGARARRAAGQAIEHLEAFRAVTGVPAGSIERRLAWARSLLRVDQ